MLSRADQYSGRGSEITTRRSLVRRHSAPATSANPPRRRVPNASANMTSAITPSSIRQACGFCIWRKERRAIAERKEEHQTGRCRARAYASFMPSNCSDTVPTAPPCRDRHADCHRSGWRLCPAPCGCLMCHLLVQLPVRRIGAAHLYGLIDRQPDCCQPEHQRGNMFCQIGNQQGNAADTRHNQNHVDCGRTTPLQTHADASARRSTKAFCAPYIIRENPRANRSERRKSMAAINRSGRQKTPEHCQAGHAKDSHITKAHAAIPAFRSDGYS